MKARKTRRRIIIIAAAAVIITGAGYGAVTLAAGSGSGQPPAPPAAAAYCGRVAGQADRIASDSYLAPPGSRGWWRDMAAYGGALSRLLAGNCPQKVTSPEPPAAS
jgi:hypothetical protein